MAAALMRKAEWEEMEIPQSWLPIPLIKVGVPVLGAEEQPSAEQCPRNGIACDRSNAACDATNTPCCSKSPAQVA
jgi:hypothetical protein